MQNTGGIIVGGAIGFNIIKAVLEVILYISIIIASFKVIQALNVYINKNTK